MPALDAAAGERTGDLAGKYLPFVLSGEVYALPVRKVREIVPTVEITPVPQMPPHVRGVFNLRGKVIPALDLRLKFGFPPQEYSARTCIIVAEVARGGGHFPTGIVVDRVSEVLSIRAGEIQPMPDFGGRVDTDYMTGIARVEGKTGIMILLDLDGMAGTAGGPNGPHAG